MNDYRKNHYIPEYYLGHFTDSNNHFYVYDKSSKWNKKISYRSPSNICFEWDRNTMFFEGKPYVDLEKVTYGYFDNQHAKTFDLLSRSKFDEFPWTFKTVGDLEFFIPLTYWRSPTSDKDFQSSLERESFLDDIRLVMKNSKDEEIEWNEGYKTMVLHDENSRKALRPIIAHSTFGKKHSINDKLEWRIVYRDKNRQKTNVISDNPIIFREIPETFPDFRGAVIVPVDKYKTLIRVDVETQFDYCHEAFLQDLMIFHQARKYVISSDKDYLLDLVKEYRVFERLGVVSRIRGWLFDKYK